MKSKGMKVVKLADLKANLFVRRELNQEHALYLAELIETGVEMNDPIEITEDLMVVDGRHRKEAFELNNVAEVKVRVLEFENEAEMIAYAYKANTGGSLPPSQSDTEHTVVVLLERGESKKRIGELLGLPAGLARKYVNQIESKANRAKVQRAVAAVVEGGLSAVKAAEQYGADLEKVKEALSPKKKGKANGIAEARRNLTRLFRSVSQKHSHLIRSLLDKYEDGDVTEKQVREVIDHLESLQKQSARSVADWRKRFDAVTGKTNSKTVTVKSVA